MTDSLSARQITRVAPNGSVKLGLRAPKSVLEELGWRAGDHVHWRAVDGHLEAYKLRPLQEDR